MLAYIAGQSIPVGRRIGHAGTIMHYGTGTAESKMNALACAAATVVRSPMQIGEQMANMIGNGLSVNDADPEREWELNRG